MAADSRRPANDWVGRLGSPSGVIVSNGAAMTAVLLHVLVDFHIGLYGPSSAVMSAAQAANAFRVSLTAGGWLVALAVAMRGSRTATACALAFVAVWVLFVNGLVAFLVVPPPSAAFPYQDVAHVGGIVFGGLATYALWRQLDRQDGSVDRRYVLLALAWLFVLGPALGVFVHLR